MKKLFSLIICLMMVCLAAGCSGDSGSEAGSYIDAGSSIECEFWFPVESSDPVTIQVLNPDGEDTVMAEVTFTPEEDEDDGWEF